MKIATSLVVHLLIYFDTIGIELYYCMRANFIRFLSAQENLKEN